jgi:hypothetical protein
VGRGGMGWSEAGWDKVGTPVKSPAKKISQVERLSFCKNMIMMFMNKKDLKQKFILAVF